MISEARSISFFGIENVNRSYSIETKLFMSRAFMIYLNQETCLQTTSYQHLRVAAMLTWQRSGRRAYVSHPKVPKTGTMHACRRPGLEEHSHDISNISKTGVKNGSDRNDALRIIAQIFRAIHSSKTQRQSLN